MTYNTMLRTTVVAALMALLGACQTAEPVAVEVPPPPSTSSAQAEQRLAAVAIERQAIEARHAEHEALCYDKFFVNNCLDDAREQLRVAMVAQRAIEIEASHYLRRAKVEERDRAIAVADAAYQEEEARLMANPPADKAVEAVPAPRAKPSAARNARTEQRAQPAGIGAAEQAANVAALEERRRKSEERQKEVARRVAEREAKAVQRRANEAAKANPKPAVAVPVN